MKLLLLSWFIPVLLTSATVTLAEDGPTVGVQQGKLQGLTLTSRQGNKYHAFLGVPYAKAPVRFGVPEPPESWSGTKLVTKYGPHCFQFCLSQRTLIGIEDCLTLNIYTPTLSQSANLSTMVLIHGGGFQFGSGSLHEGKYFVDENVILVTIQYRLGALGFLNTEDDTVTGNAGLRDQSAALRWIQDNIRNFGGDNTKVTIFGYSAGGASVHFQMLSKMSKGLFSHAISQSGSTLAPWSLQRKPKELAIRLAKNVGCTIKTSKDMVDCLRSKTPQEIVTGQLQLAIFPNEFDLISMLFIPSVEKGDHEPKFLPDTPYKLVTSGKTASKVPWMSGVTADEGALYTATILENETSLAIANADWDKMAANIFYYETSASPTVQSRITKKVKDFYFGNSKIGRDNYLQLGRVYGDRFFVTPVSRAIREHGKKPDFPIYPFIFNYTAPHSITQGLLHSKDSYGVSHGEDLKYLFNQTYGSPDYDLSTTEGQFSEKYIKLFVSFAQSGKPTSTWGSASTWKPYKNDKKDTTPIPWYVIDEDTKILTEDPFKKRTDFWENLPLRELEKEDNSNEKDEL